MSVVTQADQQLLLDPSAVSPGPVLFDVLNLSGRADRFWVSARPRLVNGRGGLLAQAPAIAPGATAQVKAIVSPGDRIGDARQGVPSSTVIMALKVFGRPRTGNSELTQP